jgi:hypothetical protein
MPDLRDELTVDILANEVRMLRTSFEGTILVLEGESPQARGSCICRGNAGVAGGPARSRARVLPETMIETQSDQRAEIAALDLLQHLRTTCPGRVAGGVSLCAPDRPLAGSAPRKILAAMGPQGPTFRRRSWGTCGGTARLRRSRPGQS